MDLTKIYADSDFANAVVPAGQILVFTGLENGKPVTRYKDSSGNFGTLSGNDGGSDVTLGQVVADGKFQPLAFNGTEASNSGNPEAVEAYYGFNGVLPVPESGGGSGGMDFYKCASVDTVAKTWMGYLAVLGDDGIYTFEETATTELNYGTAFTPVADRIYNTDATVRIDALWAGAVAYPYLRFYVDAVRGGSQIQAAEFVLFDSNDNEMYVSTLGILEVTADENNDSPSGESPEVLFNGNINDKWFSWSFNNPSWVAVQLQTPIDLELFPRYGWYTANDSSGRDPLSWKVQVSSDGITWITVSEVTDASVTEDRNALAGRWEITI